MIQSLISKIKKYDGRNVANIIIDALKLYLKYKCDSNKLIDDISRIEKLLKEINSKIDRVLSLGASFRSNAINVSVSSSINEDSLPSYMRDNPWLKVLASRR